MATRLLHEEAPGLPVSRQAAPAREAGTPPTAVPGSGPARAPLLLPGLVWAGSRATPHGSGLALAAGGVLLAGLRRREPQWRPDLLLLRLAVAAGLTAYARTAHRVVMLGHFHRQAHPTLVVSNHSHDLDGMVIMPYLYLHGPLSRVPRAVASQRLFEPGFLASRSPAWLAALVRGWNLDRILRALGALPVEDYPRRRPLASYAAEIRTRHGNLPLAAVLAPGWREQVPPGARLTALWGPRLFRLGQSPLPLSALADPYRQEIRQATRPRIEAQLAAAADALAAGDTVYLTPEGEFSDDGYLRRFREALRRLQPLAAEVVLAASAYDPFRPGRLTLYVHLCRLEAGRDLRTALAAARPVTFSQLLGAAWAGDEPLSPDIVRRRLEALRAALPPAAVLAPGLDCLLGPGLERMLAALTARGILRPGPDGLRPGRRHDPRFANVPDLFTYQAAFLAETLDALGAGLPARPGPARRAAARRG